MLPAELSVPENDGAVSLDRLGRVSAGGRIEHVFYPVFPPDGHAAEVLAWLQKHS